MSSTSSSMSQCGLSPPREATALVFEDQHYSFAQLSVLADGLAAGLRGRGVTAGDRVALMASNRPEFIVALHAVWRLAATVERAVTLVRTGGANAADIEGPSINNRFAYAPAIALGTIAAALGFRL